LPRAHSSLPPSKQVKVPRRPPRGPLLRLRQVEASPAPRTTGQAGELEKNTPQLKVTEDVLRLTVPGETIGETVGVAKNSQGHLFVFSRTGKTSTVKGSAASMLFEFDQNLKFIKQWGPNNYAAALPTPCASTRKTTSG
jgi:hypothetical protein